MNIIELLAFFGGMCFISFVILVMLLLFNFIKEFVENIKWEYKKKHRFNKPPIAKCYCKDCIYYNGKNKWRRLADEMPVDVIAWKEPSKQYKN